MLLTTNGLHTFNRIRTRGRHVFAVMLHLGNILMVITVLAPQRVGHYTAIIAPILQLPGFVLIVAAIRVQMVRILVTTYDFWFLTMSNAIFCACFAILLGDVRILSVVVGCLIVQVSICADAQVGNARQLLVSSLTNMVVHLMLFSAVLLDLVDTSSSQVVLFRYASDDHAMSTRDVLMNTQFNMIVLFAKLVYRNWRIVRGRTREGRQVSFRSVLIPQTRKCVNCQCVLKLAPTLSASTARSRGSVASTRAVSASNIAQLEFVRIREVFHVRNTIVPLRQGGFMESLLLPQTDEQRSRWNKRTVSLALLYMTDLSGSLIGSTLADPMGWFHFEWPGAFIEATSLLLSSAFCGVFFAFYHRRSLRRLVYTFDFVFLSSKITIACCCLSKFIGWDKALAVGVVLLAVDALGAHARRAHAHNRRRARLPPGLHAARRRVHVRHADRAGT